MAAVSVFDVINLLQEEVLLPAQMEGRGHVPHEVGARALVSAVLFDALDLALERKSYASSLASDGLRRTPENQQRVKQEALDWIASTEQHAYSFEWCCWHLGLDPEYIRGKVGVYQIPAQRQYQRGRGRPSTETCKRGHPRTEENVIYDGAGRKRGCRVCCNMLAKESYLRQKALRHANTKVRVYVKSQAQSGPLHSADSVPKPFHFVAIEESHELSI